MYIDVRTELVKTITGEPVMAYQWRATKVDKKEKYSYLAQSSNTFSCSAFLADQPVFPWIVNDDEKFNVVTLTLSHGGSDLQNV